MSTTTTTFRLTNCLSMMGIEAIALPCVRLDPDIKEIQNLSIIANDFDYLILTSPTAIDLLAPIFKQILTPVFIVSGSSSAINLAKYTTSNIIYPIKSSGSQAMINEVLATLKLDGKSILLIKGKNNANNVFSYLFQRKLNVSQSIIYEQEWLKLDVAYIKKILIGTNPQGIIITSSAQALYILSQGRLYDFISKLRLTTFITLHPNIVETLYNEGIDNVLCTKEASLLGVIDLIGKINGKCGNRSM